MRIRYFAGTCTLLIEFRDAPVAETRDLDESTLLDVDAAGNICAITIEHASERTGFPKLSYEQVAAKSELRLDTLVTMRPAQALYERLGFTEIPPYGSKYLPGTRFYAFKLVA